jgi:hypothetical protein
MRRFLPILAAAAIALSLAGCSSRASGSVASRADSSAGSVAVKPAPHAVAGELTGKSITAPINREVVTTGTMTIKSSTPIATGDRAASLVEAAGGRVDARSQTAATKSQPGRSNLELRIPASALTDTLASLKKLGTVESIKLSAEDVTTQGQDLDAQIHALSTSITRLLVLESKAASVDTLIKLETAISNRQGDLDSLTSQRKYLSDQVAMSTVSLRVVSPASVAASTPTTPGDAFGAGLAGFGLFFAGVLIVITYLLPWLVLAALIAVAAVYIVRRRARRSAASS